MKKIATILFLTLTGASLLQAQTFKDRLIRMREEYDTMNVVHLIMSIKVFTNEHAAKPYFEQVADVKKNDRNFRYRLGTTNMLMNNKYLIVADLNSKEIVCSKRSPKDQEEQLFKDPIASNLDSILSMYESPKVWPTEGDLEHYSFEQSKSEIRRTDLFIETSSSRLRKIEYRYADGHYVTIDFTVFDTHPFFDEDTFHEKYFVIADKGTLRASQAFRGYRVVMMDK